jgi:hypothetical protein
LRSASERGAIAQIQACAFWKPSLDKTGFLGFIDMVTFNMPSDLQIAQSLLAACVGAGHKPGKVQFTKYLYLLDYCHWRFTGRKATSLPWKFYHYGPWCEQVDGCMTELAALHAFNWREVEAPFIYSVEVPTHKLDITSNSLINQIVGTFKDRELNSLLEVAYSQTEPMVSARRGDILDFSTVPVDKKMPIFFPTTPANPKIYPLHPEKIKQIEAFRARAEKLKAKARQRMTFRESEPFHQAASMLKEEFTAPDRLPEMTGSMTIEAADGLATG